MENFAPAFQLVLKLIEHDEQGHFASAVMTNGVYDPKKIGEFITKLSESMKS